MEGYRISLIPFREDADELDARFARTALGGDTLAFAGLGESLRSFGLDLAILPINGKLGNMGGADAARVAHEAGAGLAVPCHFEMFEFNTASPEAFVQECERLGEPYRVLRAGERLTRSPQTR